MERKVPVYIGRFRLFHLGYLEVVRSLLERYPKLIVAIGAAQSRNAPDNPFSGEERAEMIRRAVQEAGFGDRVEIVQIDETHATFENWTKLVRSACPEFELVLSNDPLVRELFEEEGFPASPVPSFSRPEYSFEEIRRRIKQGISWEELVPPAVASFLKERDLVRKLELS